MKFIFLIGGIAGFALAALTGYLADRPADLVLRDAAVGCLVGALLFRWFWSVVLRSFVELRVARLKAARKPPEPAAPVAAAPAPAKPAAAGTPLTVPPPPKPRR